MTNKNYKDFLEKLIKLSQANLNFLVNKKAEVMDLGLYHEEILKIVDLINSFDFVMANKKLLERPAPKSIKDYFRGS